MSPTSHFRALSSLTRLLELRKNIFGNGYNKKTKNSCFSDHVGIYTYRCTNAMDYYYRQIKNTVRQAN